MGVYSGWQWVYNCAYWHAGYGCTAMACYLSLGQRVYV